MMESFLQILYFQKNIFHILKLFIRWNYVKGAGYELASIQRSGVQTLLQQSLPPPGGQNIFSSGVVAPRLCAAEGTLRSSRLARRKNLSVQFSIISVARAPRRDERNVVLHYIEEESRRRSRRGFSIPKESEQRRNQPFFNFPRRAERIRAIFCVNRRQCAIQHISSSRLESCLNSLR